MKKYILVAMFALAPFMASAQVAQPLTTDQISVIVEQIRVLKIQLIMQEIAELQAQIDILQGSSVTTGDIINQPIINTPSAPQQPQVQAPIVPSIAFGDTSCASGVPSVPVTVTVPYTSLMLQLGAQRTSYNHLASIDGVPAGQYNYHVQAWSGTTAPFTEGSWQDTRTLVLDTSGALTIANCN